MQALLQSCERSSLRVHYRARSDFFFLLPFFFLSLAFSFPFVVLLLKTKQWYHENVRICQGKYDR